MPTCLTPWSKTRAREARAGEIESNTRGAVYMYNNSSHLVPERVPGGSSSKCARRDELN